MELSLIYKESTDLSKLTGSVLGHIRNNNNFWYRHNNKEQLDEQQEQKHKAIVNYLKEISSLKKQFP